MPVASILPWKSLKYQNVVHSSCKHTSLRAEWVNASCGIWIKAKDVIEIQLHVESDITAIIYSEPQADQAMVVFEVMIASPCSWFKQNDLRTWRGKIIVEIDTNHPQWSIAAYKAFLTCIGDCFQPSGWGRMRFEEVVNHSLLSDQPYVERSALPITKLLDTDIACLSPTEWLNGDIVDFALRIWCWKEIGNKDPTILTSTIVFTTFFYTKLVNGGYNGVARWITEDIWEKSYILIPIHINQNHWILSIISNLSHCLTNDEPKTSIYVLDSLSSGDSQANEIAMNLKKWINHKAMNDKMIEVKSDTRVVSCQVPQQPNSYDCGAYVIYFGRHFLEQCSLENPVKMIDILEDTTMDEEKVKQVWQTEKISNIRNELLYYIRQTELYG